MRLAAFETSTEWCSVALWIDGEIRGVEERAGNRHGELVLPMLERLPPGAGIPEPARAALAGGGRPATRRGERGLPMLERLAAGAGIAIPALDAIAFGAGPGSFTGLRIACGGAQGVAFARGLPGVGGSA